MGPNFGQPATRWRSKPNSWASIFVSPGDRWRYRKAIRDSSLPEEWQEFDRCRPQPLPDRVAKALGIRIYETPTGSSLKFT